MGAFDIISGITLIGGLAFFLFGMQQLSAGLERLTGGKLEKVLKKVTNRPIKGLLVGAGITAAIQSSSAITVMLVGLVNSGIMTLGQTVGIIMGSNIGTTMTAWLLTLVGLESDNVWVKLLKPENFSLIFAFIGMILLMVSKNSRRRDVGTILIGFAVLMYGMKLMSSAVKPLAEVPAFTNFLTMFSNPFLGVLAGIVITAIIQSSSASVGILQSLTVTGALTYGAAIPIIMGQNIGTCVTALISSLGVSRNAKRVAVIHITFNIVGTVICLGGYYILYAIFRFAFAQMPIDPWGVAMVHMLFNIITTAILFPFSKLLVKVAEKILPDKKTHAVAEGGLLLDPLLLGTPSVAIGECEEATVRMATIARESVQTALGLLKKYKEEDAAAVMTHEDQLDNYEDQLGTYLVQVSAKQISAQDSKRVSKILHAIGDFERLGDHAVNMRMTALELRDKGIQFSGEAMNELKVLQSAVEEILDMTTTAYQSNDVSLAVKIEPLEQVIDGLVAVMKEKHVDRLKNGECSIELGFIFSDLLHNMGRVSDHCSNIGVSLLELQNDTLDTHQYLDHMRKEDPIFKSNYQFYRNKYTL